MTLTTPKPIPILCVMAALSACGGDGSPSAVTAPPPVADDPPVDDVAVGQFAVGPIASFGSIVVGGVRYDTDGAQFIIDDNPGSESDLAVGHVVVVEAVTDGAGAPSAVRVIYDEGVEGPIEAIDAAGSRLTVLGQTVVVTADTSFDDDIAPPSLDGLALGDWIEVSGLVDADLAIAATRIERKPPATELELHGVVSNLDSAAQRFDINALTVDYSAAILADFPAGQPREGDRVEVKGSALGASGELLATRVELETVLPPGSSAGAGVEIEGYISRFVSPADFDVGGLRVSTSDVTIFEGGSADDLALNAKVEVEGVLDDGGTLLASKVDIRRPRVVRVTAAIDSVDPTLGTLEALGILIKVDTRTRLEDKSDQELSPLTLSALNVGDYVEVRGDEFPLGSEELRASLLEREDPDEESELQGFVSEVSEPMLTILGVTITTDGATEYQDEFDRPLTATEFFAQLTPGRLVKANGLEIASTTLLAEEVQFDIED